MDAVETRISLQELAWDKIGVVRDGVGLTEAIIALRNMRDDVLPNISVKTESTACNREWIEAIQLENMVLVLEMVAKSSLTRTESRGALYRRDFPKTDNINWLKNVVLRNDGGNIAVDIQDANAKYYQPKREIRDYGRKE